ncbi:MAG: hypothetical protein WC916_05815 [Candidatus Woesearchaeota archaeon]
MFGITRLIKELIDASLKNSVINAQLEGTIDDAILRVFDNINEILQETEEHMPFNGTIPRTIIKRDNEKRDYTKISLETYLDAGQTIEFTAQETRTITLEAEKEIRQDLQEATFYLNKNLKMLKRAFSVNENDTYESFRQKNKNNEAYYDLQQDIKMHANVKYLFEEIAHKKEILIDINNTFSTAKKNYASILNEAQELKKNLALLTELRDSKKIIIPVDEADEVFIDLIGGKINRRRAQKKLTEIIEKEKINTVEYVQEKNTFARLPAERKVTYFNPEEINYLQSKGFANKQIKELLESNNFDIMKEFIEHIDAIFAVKKIIPVESKKVYTTFPNLFKESKKYLSEYVETLGVILDIYNPQKVSGILPSNNIKLYSTQEELNAFITKRQTNTQAKLVHQERITNEKDHERFTNEALQNPFMGEAITKYKLGRVKTIMYEHYSKEFGEGHFRKVKFGERRAVFKLSNEGNAHYIIDVCAYFDKHQFYSGFYKKSR